MSIPPNLLAAARSSYRNVLKAGTKTFQGDARLLEAWREKARNEFVKGRSITDVRQYQDRITLANEVATVLRTNIVQAEQGGSEVWTLRLTNDTEIGDNMTIKNPEPVECKGSKARRKKAEAEAAQQATERLNKKALFKAHQQRIMPELREEDLEEMFVRGSGPGGQATNKTSNNVSLIHKPTGIRVTCHQTRSQATNRRLARRMLLEKLDQMQNPGLTKADLVKAKKKERERQKAKKQKKKKRQQTEECDSRSEVEEVD
ncbi:hypothetical protein M407DRAFT_84505 [Tulasnella calospora MUT 4182]|uniref:Prokaryotic-type class I peptide chain release factors domain-containing protein n=1 Tax=Tulasnella calospora MUT 4182 TaxID=1051891 RepID=A0A0C3Q411_9AGAM|nr:hypothetical protein M407DRAFT_84505 [Tulasnella calospora MUT 4182]